MFTVILFRIPTYSKIIILLMSDLVNKFDICHLQDKVLKVILWPSSLYSDMREGYPN